MNDIDLTEATDPKHRAAVVAGIRALALLIEDSPELPVPNSVAAQYSIMGDLTSEGVELVRRAAAILEVGAEVDGLLRASAAKQVAGSASGPYFRVTYTVYGSTDKPDPALTSDVRQVVDAFAPADSVLPEHELLSAWGPGAGECGAQCACGVVFDGFDSFAEATEQIEAHVADPTGLGHIREPDEPDDPTPVSPARVPLHAGAVVDGGQLVDVTPVEPVRELLAIAPTGDGGAAWALSGPTPTVHRLECGRGGDPDDRVVCGLLVRNINSFATSSAGVTCKACRAAAAPMGEAR